MKVDIYKSQDTSGRYFVVRSGSDVSNLPEKVSASAEKTVDINAGENLIGVSGGEVINDISSKGYHATDVSISIQIDENT